MSSLPPPPPPGFPPAPPSTGGGVGFSGTGARASFGARLGANLLDSLLYGLLSMIPAIGGVIAIVAAFADCSEPAQTADGLEYTTCGSGELKSGLLVLGIALIVLGMVLVWVMQVRHLATRGQTWGRKIVGIKVVRADNGQPIGYGRAIGRLLFAGMISGSFCMLGYLWMLWDKDQQTWHDKVVGSVVVRA